MLPLMIVKRPRWKSHSQASDFLHLRLWPHVLAWLARGRETLRATIHECERPMRRGPKAAQKRTCHPNPIAAAERRVRRRELQTPARTHAQLPMPGEAADLLRGW